MDQPGSPLDPLVDLLVYAPIGMIYELPQVLPQAIKRGKSQVQLTKVMAQMAKASGSNDGPLTGVETTLSVTSQIVAKALYELADAIHPETPAPPSDS